MIIQKCLKIFCLIDNYGEEGDIVSIIDDENKNIKKNEDENNKNNRNDLNNDIVKLPNVNKIKDKINSESNEYKTTKIINLINDIKPIRNDISYALNKYP